MKLLRFTLLFCLLATLTLAQSVRLYPVGNDRVIADGATGTVLFVKPNTSVSLSAKRSDVVQLEVNGVLFGAYLPANFLKQDGTPYSLASVAAAVQAYKDLVLASSGGDQTATANALTTTNLIAQIVSQAIISNTNNPHYNGLASGVTLTVEASGLQAGISNVTSALSGTVVNANAPFSYYGGSPSYTNAGGGFLSFPVATFSTTGGNAGNGQNKVNWRVGFKTDAPKVSISMWSDGSYRFIVDGQYVSLSPTNPGYNGGTKYVTLDFSGSVKIREIQVEGELSGGFQGVATGQGYKIIGPKSPRVIFVGDSYTAGSGSSVNYENYVRVAGDYLGVRDVWSSGNGGTGYVTGNGSYNFAQRTGDWLTKSPDVVVFAGGINDPDDGTLQPAVLSLLQATRTALPKAILMVMGVWPASSGPGASTISKENKIAAAVTQFADKYTAFIPISTDPAGAWITGTGRVGATTGTGNADITIGSDATHPTDYGHYYLGLRTAEAIVRALKKF